jgi:hypothetical protein
MTPTRLLSRLALVSTLVLLAGYVPVVARLPRGVLAAGDTPPSPAVRARVRAAAERLAAPGAWAAAAMLLPAGGQESEACWQRAQTAAPRDEALLVTRALTLLAPDAGKADQARVAVAALVGAYPDNAVGHYLLAAEHARAGDRAACLAALRAGHAAPGYRLCGGQARLWRARLYQAMGLPACESWLLTWGTFPFHHLDVFRGIAREMVRDGAADDQTVLAVLRLGSRVRDEAEVLIEVLTGCAITGIAVRRSEPSKLLKSATREQRWAEVHAAAGALATRLRATGRPADAAWVAREAARTRDLQALVHDPARRATIPEYAVERHFYRLGAWGLVVTNGALAALLVLIWATVGWRRLGARRPLVWRWRDLAAVWVVALLPYVCAVVVGALRGVAGGPRPGALLAVTACAAWPVLVVALVVRWLAGRYARRQPGAPPDARRDFARRARLSLALPTAVLLLLGSQAALAPLAWQRRVFRAELETMPARTRTVLRATMDAAAVSTDQR